MTMDAPSPESVTWAKARWQNGNQELSLSFGAWQLAQALDIMSRHSEELEAKLCAYETVISSGHHILLNMNDAFSWATADSEEMSCDDVGPMLPTIRRYGEAALRAYAGVIMGVDPDVSDGINIPEGYWQAKEEVKAMYHLGQIMFSRKYDEDRKSKDVLRFGGRVDYSTLTKNTWCHRHSSLFKGMKDYTPGLVVNVARLESGLVAVGWNQSAARDRLWWKFNRNECRREFFKRNREVPRV